MQSAADAAAFGAAIAKSNGNPADFSVEAFHGEEDADDERRRAAEPH